jgi:hypothetical protein
VASFDWFTKINQFHPNFAEVYCNFSKVREVEYNES